jgi:three-Cys-motif partner protein
MADNKNFYNDQSDRTAAKIYFYENYIQDYLIKILMQFGKCVVFDLFCGKGMNGTKKGSPLTLLDNLDYLLPAPLLKQKQPNLSVKVYFNDCDHENIKQLELELENRKDVTEIEIITTSDKFSEVINKLSQIEECSSKIPKFFFLDPFTYSDIKTSDLKKLLDLENSEILLFCPVFHAYRFCKVKPPQKLVDFLNDFTVEGVYDYKNIHEFTASIRKRLSKELGTNYIRPLLIEDKSSKNCLFLITRNITGVDLLNNLVWQTSSERFGINLSRERKKKALEVQPTLFCVEDRQIGDISKLVLGRLKLSSMTNKEMIEFIVINLYRLTDANCALKKLKDEGKIIVTPFAGYRNGCLYTNITPDNRFKPKTIFSIKK